MTMRSRLVLCSIRSLLFAVSTGLMVSGAQAEDPIVSEGAQLEKLFEGKVLTEGVCVALDGMVYFSEITFSHVSKDANGAIDAGYIWKFDPSTKKTTIFGMSAMMPFLSFMR